MTFSLTVKDSIEAIRALDPELRAYVSTRLCDAAIDAEARAAEETPRSPLHGVPYSLKDEWETTCLPTTAGSARHRHRRSPSNSPVYETLEAAGAVLMGKSNLSDMGLAPEATNYLVGATRNPHDLSRTAGGSSGGSAAAVAARMVAFDWGTDIGGSIRLPAAFCGILGLKLSSRTWPCRGMFPTVPGPLNWMCSQGPLATSIDAIRAIVDVTSPTLSEPDEAEDFELEGATIFAPDHVGEWPSFVENVESMASRALPVTRDGTLPPTREIMDLYGGVWASHLESLLEADPTVPSIFSGLRAVLSSVFFRGVFGDRRFHPLTAELLALIALGRVTLHRRPEPILEKVHALRTKVESIWSRGQVIIAPVCMFPPPRIGRSNRNPRLLACTALGNLVDATALTLPFGVFSGLGLPRAIQLMGPPGSERTLLELGECMMSGGR